MGNNKELLPIGTKVTCAYRGYGEVVDHNGSHTYPITIEFQNGSSVTFTKDLKVHTSHKFGLQVGRIKTFKQRIKPKKEGFKKGDKVTSQFGKGVIISIQKNNSYPIKVEFENDDTAGFTMDGRYTEDAPITLFKGHLDEICIKIV